MHEQLTDFDGIIERIGANNTEISGNGIESFNGTCKRARMRHGRAAPRLRGGRPMAGFLTQLLPPSAYEAADGSFRRASVAAKVALSTAAMWAVIMLAPSGVAPFIYFQF